MFVILFNGVAVSAVDSIVEEVDGKSYNYISFYEVTIDQRIGLVWPQLKNLSSWMFEFELSNVAGDIGQEGEVLRLYPKQDFFIQVAKIIPEKLFAIVNLPVKFKDELSTGNAIIHLTEVDEKTVVSITMNRRYTWLGQGENPMRAIRKSESFAMNSKVMWEEKFLGRLKQLTEKYRETPKE
jgi:hypothetical protein